MIKQGENEKRINLYCIKNDISIDKYFDLLFEQSDLTKLDKLLFETFIENNESYRKTATSLYSSRYIVKKEITRIKNNLLETNKKILNYDN